MLRKFLIYLFITLAVGLVLAIAGGWYLQKLQKAGRDNQPPPKKDISITIIEGMRREEIAARFARAGICSYTSFLAASQGLEGALFPDTYRFFPGTPAIEVAKKMVDNFSVKTKGLNLTQDQVTLASIIEREALKDEERALIAGVYTNRLSNSMKLQADPTVQYGKDSNLYTASLDKESFEFWKSITQDDYRSVVSDYNTYLKEGLPPGPIANPGLKSLVAAVNPAEHNFLYFLHRNQELLLSETLAEHLSKQ